MVKNNINLTILFANKNILIRFNCIIREGTTISCLLSRYNIIFKKYIDIKIENLHFGIFGEKKHPSYKLKSGDRVEIYEKLFIEPIVRRRKILSKK